MTRGHRERDCSHEVPHSPGPGDRPTRTCRRWSAIPLGSLRAHGSRCAVPPASARIFSACLPRAAPLTWNPSPLSSRLTRFLSCSTMSGSPGTTSRRSSRLTALVSWKSFSGSPLCSLRTLSSLHSSGDRLAPRQPRSVTTVVPCLSNDMPTAGGSWTRTSRGKLAPGNHPEDTPSLRFHGAHGSVWVVAVVAVFPKTYAVAWIQTASIGKARIAPRITGEGHGNPLQSSRLETPMGGGAR